MKSNVICISRAIGSGGEEVGRAVAKKLGYRYVDEELVSVAAARAGVEVSEMADEERRKSRLRRLLDDLAAGGGEAWTMGLGPYGSYDAGVTSDELREHIRDAIDETAADGDVVIVAHAAAHALAGRDDVLRVLVTASEPTRADRVARLEGMDEQRAARAIEDSDAGRADYLRRFYEVGRELPTHYDLVVNTDRISTDEAVSLVCAAAS